MRSNKGIKLIRIIGTILLFILLTFLLGFFVRNNIFNFEAEICAILFALFGLSLTIYTFIQGTVQNIKSTFIKKKKNKDYIFEKFSKIDSIVEQLSQDIKAILFSTLAYLIIVFFFKQIVCNWFEILLKYLQSAIFISIALAIIDLTYSMFTLSKINAELNKNVVCQNNEENKNAKSHYKDE